MASLPVRNASGQFHLGELFQGVSSPIHFTTMEILGGLVGCHALDNGIRDPTRQLSIYPLLWAEEYHVVKTRAEELSPVDGMVG
jgi:hypothetical protein